jgi:hypothetical protein
VVSVRVYLDVAATPDFFNFSMIFSTPNIPTAGEFNLPVNFAFDLPAGAHSFKIFALRANGQPSYIYASQFTYQIVSQ